MKIDYLIIGQGLAGSLVAWECARRGRTFRVVDPGSGRSASHTAAGLYNPISGKRLVHDPLEDAMVRTARETFLAMATQWKTPVWLERNIQRLFTSEQEITQYEKRKQDPAYAGLIGPPIKPGPLAPGIEAPRGGFSVRQGGQINLSGVACDVRRMLATNGLLIEAAFRYDELAVGAQRAHWREFDVGTVICCEGYRVSLNPYFDSIPWRHAKGEVLDLFIPDLKIHDVINAGVSLIPMGNGKYILGATYEWDDLDENPSPSGEAQLIRSLNSFCTLPVEVVGHRAAVRPVAFDRTPVIGRHPTYPPLALFNGLGAKGAVRGPWAAKMLMDHLDDGTTLDPRYSVQHHWRPDLAS